MLCIGLPKHCVGKLRRDIAATPSPNLGLANRRPKPSDGRQPLRNHAKHRGGSTFALNDGYFGGEPACYKIIPLWGAQPLAKHSNKARMQEKFCFMTTARLRGPIVLCSSTSRETECHFNSKATRRSSYSLEGDLCQITTQYLHQMACPELTLSIIVKGGKDMQSSCLQHDCVSADASVLV